MKLHKIMHSVHLYTGLFLWPWLLVYATSGFIFNHSAGFNKLFGTMRPQFETLQETDFSTPADFPYEPAEQARAILKHLEMDGPHNVIGRQSNDQQLVIFRISATGNIRITWHRPSRKLTVQKLRPFSVRRLVHFLHFRHGYHQSYAAPILWAIIVDAVTISLWLWVISGLYLWWRMPRKRIPGGISIGIGLFLFLLLVYMMCR